MLGHMMRTLGMRGRVGSISFIRKLTGPSVGIGADIPGHCLDDIMKTDLLKDESKDTITKVWTEHHKTKDGMVSGVVPSMHYAEMYAKGTMCPRFVYALPKEQGFDMYYSEIHGHRVSFTLLETFKRLAGNAPPALELFHYADFQDTKDIVLMRGVQKWPLSPVEATFLVNQYQMYYRIDPERFKLVKTFNFSPDSFDFEELLKNVSEPAVKSKSSELGYKDPMLRSEDK